MPKKLSKRQKEMVREWLEYDKRFRSDCCPFDVMSISSNVPPCKKGHPHEICASWFPRVRENYSCPSGCPCYRYALSTVIRRAKEMVK